MPFPQSLPRLIAAVFLVVSLVSCFELPVEAKRRKSRRATARTNNTRSSQVIQIVPDKIEVIENGSSDSTALARWLNPPLPAKSFNSNFAIDVFSTPVRHINVRMEQSRVIEIQQALTSQGFFQGEMTGIYDEATVDAMRRFQSSEKISVTGYPTAHALKRLGLTKW